MLKAAKYIFALLVAATVAPATLASTAGKGDSLNLRWRTPVIRLAVSNSLYRPVSGIKADSDISGALKRSIAAWSDVADIDFLLTESDRQGISPSGPAGDGYSLITIAQTPENVMLFSRDPNSESARTRVFYNRSGTITEADIVLNPFLQFSTDGSFGTFDLESTLTHEIGHLLGVRHSGVLGSIMSESLARNNELTFLDGPRKLAASDIAAVRQMYGASRASECCASVTGRLTGAFTRSDSSIMVWAEENGTGRVAAWTEATSDGSFVLGGLPVGSYSVLWQRATNKASSTIGHIGSVKLAAGEQVEISEKVSNDTSPVGIYFIGLNSQLTDAALSLEAGREHIVYLGGTNLDIANIDFEFNSPFITVMPGTVRKQDFGDDLSVVSFALKISPETPRGAYSIFATNDAGIQGSLVGAVTVK